MVTDNTSKQDDLIKRHIPFAVKLATDLVKGLRGTDLDDLVAEALLALTEAGRSFDPVKHPGVIFSAYARIHIYGHLCDYLDRDRDGLVGGISRRLRRAATELRRAHAELVARGDEATVEALAEETGLQRKIVVEALLIPKMTPSGIEADAEPSGAEAEDAEALGQADDLWSALDHCNHRERDVMTRRFGLDGRGERSRGAVAAELGIEVKAVRKAEESARRKLDGRLRMMA